MPGGRSATIVLLLALSACASAPLPSRHAWANYTCADGQTVQAKYPNTNTAIIKLKGVPHTLHVAISGSGARYIGEGWQWWTKGMHEGMLAPLGPGESIASNPGVVCHTDEL